MIGLSKDIERAVNTILKGLEHEIDLEEIKDDKIKESISSKIKSFDDAKTLLDKWQNSPNRPSQDTIKYYVGRLLDIANKHLSTLRLALGKEVDYDLIDYSRHHFATGAKTAALEYIFNLESSLFDLKLQLNKENISLGSRDYKVGYPERFARGDFYPISNYHKKWYNKKEDAIMICPKGTMGKLIDIMGIRIQLPKEPPRSEMLFYDCLREDQFWKRNPMPIGLTPENEEAFTEYIYEEYRRRREGVWFLNDGKPVYLTGSAYFAMQWCKMFDNGGYMEFRYAQLHIFYFSEACHVDPRCLGMIFTKARRAGYTYIQLFRMLNLVTSVKNGTYGMTSHTNEYAAKTFFKLTYAFRNLPFFFKPILQSVSTDKLQFGLPQKKGDKAKEARDDKTDEYLNSIVDYQPTTDGAYDSQAVQMYLGDEASKWRKPSNYLNHWGRFSPTMDEGGVIVGKAYIGSTVNPMKQGGAEFKKLVEQSRMDHRSKITGRTASGLYSCFLGAEKNMRKFTDKFGVCHEVKPIKKTYNTYGDLIKMGSIDYLMAQRSAKKNTSSTLYNEELRANPMRIDEAFRDSSKDSIFDINKINEQLEYIDNIPSLDKLISTGNFLWEKGIKDTKVVWSPDPKGRFKVSWLPSEQSGLRNNIKTIKGVKHPGNKDIGCFGCDSYDIGATVDGRGSKGALHGVTGTMVGDHAPSDCFFLEYIYRHSLPEMFYEDVLMACVFYGMPVLMENNKPRILYYFKNRGYRGFSLNRPDRTRAHLSVTEREIGGVPSTSNVIAMNASMLQSYIINFVGVYNPHEDQEKVREIGSIGNLLFEETLRDWLNFDMNNRTKYDASVSSGLALMGLNRTALQPEVKTTKINMGFSTYDNNGNSSQLM